MIFNDYVIAHDVIGHDVIGHPDIANESFGLGLLNAENRLVIRGLNKKLWSNQNGMFWSNFELTKNSIRYTCLKAYKY